MYHCEQDGKTHGVAVAFSECRDKAQGTNHTNENLVYSDIDLYGRNGGNCAEAYLKTSLGCHFNPETIVCNNTRID